MKGTEKQIKYALDILEKVKAEAKSEIEHNEKAIAECEASGRDAGRRYRMQAKAERVLAAVEQMAESDIHAGVIINVLCSYYSILEHLEAHGNDVERMIRYTI